MTYTRLQSYTNMAVGEHEIETIKVVVVVLSSLLLLCDVFVPQVHIPYYYFGQVVCPNIFECQLELFDLYMGRSGSIYIHP